jgi:hypothetical protein
MSRDPFRGRHARRRHIAQHAGAATRPAGLGATVARAATIAADRFTPCPGPITLGHGSQAADRRLCPALAVSGVACIPAGR